MRLLVVLAAALVAAPVAQAGGFYEAKVLEPAASYVAKKPVKVWCATTAASWRVFLNSVGGEGREANGWAIVGGIALRLSPDACPSLRGAVGGVPQFTPTLAATVEVLTHEAIHTRGVRDEGVTDCDAMHEMPGVAVRFFHITSGKQLRALMASAWAYHREAAPPYLTVC